MQEKLLNIYLSGEIHTNWRESIKEKCIKINLPISFSSPVTHHENSDDCGVRILGDEPKKFWHDYKGASMNSIRTRTFIEKSDILIVKFGDKYRQWNAAFDAGIASSLGKSIITLHDVSLDHALKEIDAIASAICRNEDQVVSTLNYIFNGDLDF